VNDKLLTRDNLSKRRKVDDASCLFCNEQESAKHLFFDCVVARYIWNIISEVFGIAIGENFESVARWWISENKNYVLNIFSSATLWTLWSIRNEMCFQGLKWPGVKEVMRRIGYLIKSWRLLCLDKHSELLDANLMLLDRCRGELLWIAWI
jgi:hypothetical protein